MSLDQRITSAVINSVINHYKQVAKESLHDLRMNLDLDHDGRGDLDQAVELVEKVAAGLKRFALSIDFDKVGTGLDKLVGGLAETTAAINIPEARTSLSACKESSTQLLELVGLAVANYKSKSQDCTQD